MVMRFWASTIGKKIVVAITGLVLFLFLVGHMAGNLKAFAGADPQSGIHKLDIYAAFLRSMGHELFGHAGLLWIFRIGLIVALFLHVLAVLQLQQRNFTARPVAYQRYKFRCASASARSMLITGILLLLFVVYHLLHLTFGGLHFQGFKHGHVYANIHATFQVPEVVLVYVFALACMGLHVFHGVWSLFQTLGLDSPQRNIALRVSARLFALLLFVGFASVPVAIMWGGLKAPPQKFIEQH